MSKWTWINTPSSHVIVLVYLEAFYHVHVSENRVLMIYLRIKLGHNQHTRISCDINAKLHHHCYQHMLHVGDEAAVQSAETNRDRRLKNN